MFLVLVYRVVAPCIVVSLCTCVLEEHATFIFRVKVGMLQMWLDILYKQVAGKFNWMLHGNRIKSELMRMIHRKCEDKIWSDHIVLQPRRPECTLPLEPKMLHYSLLNLYAYLRCRVFERRYGSHKFASYLLATCTIATILETTAILVLQHLDIDLHSGGYLPPGPWVFQ